MNQKPAVGAPRGYVDRIGEATAAGWAYSDGQAVRVRAVSEGVVLAEAATDKPRPDVEAVLKKTGNFGYVLHFPSKIDHPDRVVVEAFDGTSWHPLPNSRPRSGSSGRRRYQDFDGTGASKSFEKLKALNLPRIPNRSSNRELPLSGLSVLDLGCSEGYFCRESLRLGASRVVGIDQREGRLRIARRECPDGDFIHGTWWDLPDERFDLILFLSAIHYERRQRALLDKLIDHLTPDGTLVLECGVVSNIPERRWGTALRHDGIMRYPTMEMLRKDLLLRYAVRVMGRSVDQAGDPVPRFVFHCTPRVPVVLLLAAVSRSGKTVLADSLGANMPRYSTDALFYRLISDPLYAQRPIASFVKDKIEPGQRPDFGRLAQTIVDNDALTEEICEIIVSEACLDSPTSCIEGDLLRHEVVMTKVSEKLSKLGARTWVATPR